MSCCSYFPSCSCTLDESACGDPGLETTAKHLAIYDSQFCPRRLSATTGFLAYGTNGFSFTSDPRVTLTEQEVADEELFAGLVINTAGGAWRRITPAAGVEGVLTADGSGNVSFQEYETTIPDPLTVTTLNATDATLTNITSSGTVTLTGLLEDTVTQYIGLNGSNELVIGDVQTISIAQFYESPTTTSNATPNWTYPATASANVQIGNEISDPDSIAHVEGQETIRIDTAGNYLIRWSGQYLGYNAGTTPGGDVYTPGLWLKINDVTVSKGNIQGFQDRALGCYAGGEYFAQSMAVNDSIKISGNGSGNTDGTKVRGTGLMGVTLTLIKQ